MQIPDSYLPDAEAAVLIAAAQLAAERSHSPYSRFAVGAAVLTTSGQIYKGANIENASYGLTICAERIALGHAFSNIVRPYEITAIAVYGPGASLSPCGACRQFIIEFGKNIIIIFRYNGLIMQKRISELLPFEFLSRDLGR